MRNKIQSKNILQFAKNTPLIEVNGIYAKLETYNPTGSVKDRMAFHVIKKAEQRGELNKGDEIIEITSGNTGIALAMASAIKGYKFTAIMPKSMSLARRKMMKVFGANIILTPAEEDMEGALKKYQQVIQEKISKKKKIWLPKQFENQDNINAHYFGLGKEIINQTEGKVDAFVAGAGTGGTIIGVAKALKEVNPKTKIYVVEPEESAVLSGNKQGLHKIQGIGEGFIPKILKDNLNLVDEIITIKSKDSIKASEHLAKKRGILVGISSGANYLAAQKLKKKYENVVTIFADRGERYL
ncbi:cysteine synthase family protein [archaeon]|jgi:cysteine synthase|nr:cysteine synthase family protein [archaeon]MBT3451470.1 cysteine synthase family protein [archaeon]MBT6868536.1 cysteine synthase family protein [archaeon]MBT7193070.1 cysteine synthase family protein [archaeon]MBT7381159.1 cysteine synthase family protein [archaeon]